MKSEPSLSIYWFQWVLFTIVVEETEAIRPKTTEISKTGISQSGCMIVLIDRSFFFFIKIKEIVIAKFKSGDLFAKFDPRQVISSNFTRYEI